MSEKPSFDRVSFLARQKQENVPFLTEMYSPGEPDLVFFDQSIDAKKNRSKLKLRKVDTPFLQGASAHKNLTKVNAIPPNDSGLNEFEYDRVVRPFLYKRWPDTFDDEYFSNPRPIPKMITAEFDRKALLVSKLHVMDKDVSDDDEFSDDIFDDDDDIMEFYGGDYDPSPEVATFTVFFFVYSALVGRDWQKYKHKRHLEQIELNQQDSVRNVTSTTESRDGMIIGRNETEGSSEQWNFEANRTGTDACLADLSFGLCQKCPDVGLESIFVSIRQGAEESFDCFFERTVEQVQERNAEDRESLRPSAQSQRAVAEYEEARAVASAQLDLAFETLKTLSLRRLSADSDCYLSLIEACGRCGDTQYAVKLMDIMKKDGFVADSEVLASFIAAFASHEDDEEGIEVDESSHHSGESLSRSDTDAYSRFLEKQYESAKYQGFSGAVLSTIRASLSLQKDVKAACSDLVSNGDDDSVSSGGSSRTPTGGMAFTDWFNYHRPQHLTRNGKRRRQRRNTSSDGGGSDVLPITEMLERQNSLGETLLDFVYPDLHIDTNSETCPHCSFVMSEGEITSGWTGSAFTDYNTTCPKCQYKFVPQFVVTTSAPDFEGSQGPGTPLYCEFLSPWVIRKELHATVKGDIGIEGMLNPEWRNRADISSALFWNLMVLFRRYRLPFAFLLQGNFHNRLILPPMPDET